MASSQDNDVYMSLMSQRTENDKNNIRQYNCINYKRTITPSIVSMLAPAAQASFVATQVVNPNVMYMLNPTPDSVKAMAGASQDINTTYPPSCNFDKMPNEGVCRNSTSNAYPGLDFAYSPTTGSKNINLGQNLNMQYSQNK